MVVPNYVPEPIEIPDNVTEQPYAVRVKFIRRMQAFQVISVGLVAAAACLPALGTVSLLQSLVALFSFLIVMCVVRISLRSTRIEASASSWAIPILLMLVAILARSLFRIGLPVWSSMFGIGIAYIYTLLCGRDFSFVGQWVLSLTMSSVMLAVLSILMGHQGAYAGKALLINALTLTYFVYDGASMLSRRRMGEELAAVVDLYRDVLNFFGFVPRVVHHWHKHRIWQLR